MTRYTSSIESVEGKLNVNPDGSLTFIEQDGIDFQAITVQLPGGERVPFLFTIKSLVATTQPGLSSISTSTDFEGVFKVPSYRTSNFLDPKGRGLTAGYESAVGLPAQADDEELAKENTKQFQLDKGHISLQIAKIDNVTGEIAGTFESEQPSETDMGSKKASDIKIRGFSMPVSNLPQFKWIRLAYGLSKYVLRLSVFSSLQYVFSRLSNGHSVMLVLRACFS